MEHDFEEYSYTIFDNKYIIDEFFVSTMAAFRATVASWKGYEGFLPNIDYLSKNLCEIGKFCHGKNPHGLGYNVLNHSDIHSRNILFKYNEMNRIEKFQFVNILIFISPHNFINSHMFLFSD